MKNFKIKYAAAYNFLPFGPEGIQLDFTKHKNIVLVSGENRDARQIDTPAAEDMRSSSNGTGKSSIQEIIVWGLYGKTVKRPEKIGANDVVHNKIGKDAKVEIVFDNFRIVRTRKENGSDKKNNLRLWESDQFRWEKDTEITQGTMALTQKRIEDIIGLSYDAFVNICIFTDDQRACFLECDNKQKKEIVENMLSLGMYREWSDNARSIRRELKADIETKAKEFAILKGNKEDAERRLALTKQKDEKWRADKKKELEELNSNLNKLLALLTSTDDGQAVIAYENAQQRIKEINEKLPVFELARKELESKLTLAKTKEDGIRAESLEVSTQYSDISKVIKDLMESRKKKEQKISEMKRNVAGRTCDKCLGEISQENIDSYISKTHEEIDGINSSLQDFVESAKKIDVKIAAVKEKQSKVKGIIEQITQKASAVDKSIKSLSSELVSCSQVREPKVDQQEAVVKERIDSVKQKIEDKNKEVLANSPFVDIINNDEEELAKSTSLVEEKDKEVKDLESELPYLDYWITGFGDHGIRKWVVDGIIPELNNRVNYWLQFLIDNRITLSFDNELNERIQRNPVDGDPYVYHAMSTGQRRRMNLAVSQSFAHIMSMSSGSVPSIVFLDEVTTNVDPLGVQGIHNMILELAEDKQVFITTHDHDLARLLDGCDNLRLVHENGFTKLHE